MPSREQLPGTPQHRDATYVTPPFHPVFPPQTITCSITSQKDTHARHAITILSSTLMAGMRTSAFPVLAITAVHTPLPGRMELRPVLPTATTPTQDTLAEIPLPYGQTRQTGPVPHVMIIPRSPHEAVPVTPQTQVAITVTAQTPHSGPTPATSTVRSIQKV